MKIRTSLLTVGLFLAAPALAAVAQTGAHAPVTVSITKPLTPISDVLATLARQTGQTILADDTVVAPVGVADLSAPTLDAMLTSLQALDPGMTWEKVYLPKDAVLPTANDLSAQVRTLQEVATSHLVIAGTTGTISFARGKVLPASPASSSLRMVYLVTDETVRAQREASKKAEAARPQGTGPSTSVDRTATGMQSVADTFSQMTPDEQRQALPAMFEQFRRIMQAMDPGVRADVQQGMRQWARGGQNGPGNGQ